MHRDGPWKTKKKDGKYILIIFILAFNTRGMKQDSILGLDRRRSSIYAVC